MDVLNAILRFLNEINFDIRAKALNFIPTLGQISKTCF